MADEFIRLDTTIIGIDSLINKALTAEEVKVLFTVKDVIYSQQRYFTDVQPVNRWISVKDRLPDDCVEVLVHDTDCGIVIGWYDKKDSIFVAEFINQLDAVTHWMSLPEPPQD